MGKLTVPAKYAPFAAFVVGGLSALSDYALPTPYDALVGGAISLLALFVVIPKGVKGESRAGRPES